MIVAALAACTGGKGGPLGPDPASFATVSSEAELRAALPPEAELAAACPGPDGPLSYAGARALWAACELAPLGSAARFAASPGDRLLAARLHRWLVAQGAADTLHAPRLLLGEPPFAGDLSLPVLDAAPAAPVVAWADGAGRTDGPRADGRFPWWGVAGAPPADGLALPADTPLDAVRTALASSAPDGRALPLLVGNGAGLGAVALALPDGSAAAAVPWATPLALPPDGAIRLDPPGDLPLGDLVAALGPALGRRIELAVDAAPCLAPPAPGLRCVRGDAAHPTLYVEEAPPDDLVACQGAEICQSARGTWAAARERCSFRGLRLPTRWEAERAGWTADPAWTDTWAGPDGPPRGTCDGAPKCRRSTQRLTSDGAAHPPSAALPAAPRCVTSDPWVTTWPPSVIAHPRPPRPPPAPPTESELAVAWGVQGDGLDDKGICGEEVRKDWHEDIRQGGRSTTECRDPYSYVTTNEPERYLFQRFVANAGGIYVGVGSDQSYDFISAQRPDWAFVYDYDPNVVRFHRVMQALLRIAPTRRDLVSLWGPDRAEEAEKQIAATWPDDAAVLQSFFHGYRRRIHDNFEASLEPMKAAPTFGFLATDEGYEVVHTLAVQKRIVPVPVDLLETVGLRSIGAAAKALGQPVRAFYTSNAPTAWGGQLTPEYKANVNALPMDARSMVLATYNWGAWHQVGRWRYDIAYGPLVQQRLASDAYWEANQTSWDRVPGDHGNLTVVALPSSWPDGP